MQAGCSRHSPNADVAASTAAMLRSDPRSAGGGKSKQPKMASTQQQPQPGQGQQQFGQGQQQANFTSYSYAGDGAGAGQGPAAQQRTGQPWPQQQQQQQGRLAGQPGGGHGGAGAAPTQAAPLPARPSSAGPFGRPDGANYAATNRTAQQQGAPPLQRPAPPAPEWRQRNVQSTLLPSVGGAFDQSSR